MNGSFHSGDEEAKLPLPRQDPSLILETLLAGRLPFPEGKFRVILFNSFSEKIQNLFYE